LDASVNDKPDHFRREAIPDTRPASSIDRSTAPGDIGRGVVKSRSLGFEIGGISATNVCHDRSRHCDEKTRCP
jgi:hypothetical protein